MVSLGKVAEGPPVGSVLVDVRVVSLGRVAEGLPAGSVLVDVRVVSLGKVGKGLLWREVLSDGTVALTPVVVIAPTVSVLLLSVEGGMVFPPVGVHACMTSTTGS